jgi:hypothetical protein
MLCQAQHEQNCNYLFNKAAGLWMDTRCLMSAIV